MKQIRKFEQESIVNQIMEGVNERLNAKVEKAKKSKDYKTVEKLADVVVKLQKEIEFANQKRSDALNRVNEAIKNYNEFSTDKMVGLSSMNNYNDSRLKFFRNDWQVKQQVSDKLAIALLEPNAQERIKEIIMAIASEVS
tara:strand:+ start:15682 stop:16101 length:420 start_codon:yes stop_codon:yes gene_type:complete